MQPKTSLTSTNRIKVDASFVRTTIYDCYDELTEANTLLSVSRVLNKAFEKHDVSFHPDAKLYQGLHPLSFKESGIVDAEIDAKQKIRVRLWSEVMYVLREIKRFERFVRLMSSLIRHELVHREQGVRSNFMFHSENLPRRFQGKDEWVEYYGDRHELGAMAFEIVENFQQARINTSDVIKELAKSRSAKLSQASMRYCDILEHCDLYGMYKKEIVHRLKKNIYQVLCN